MKIALDIGHATGTGASGNGLEEHEVSKRIVSILKPLLEKQGHSVSVIDFPNLINKDDLKETILAANAGAYNAGISIHCDASDNATAKGGHVCYASMESKKLADSIAGPLVELLPGRSEKTVNRTNLAILNQTKPVWVLVECGFITNKDDAKLMGEHPELIADAISRGVGKYFC